MSSGGREGVGQRAEENVDIGGRVVAVQGDAHAAGLKPTELLF
jgi:uncharacterized Zn-binding protein involved in type VI secretion